MKLGSKVLAVVGLVGALSGGCSRNRQEAVILAGQADNEVKLNPEGATAKYEQATQLDPTNHVILHKLAKAYAAREEWDKSASTLARASNLAPKFANYQFERGWALEQLALKAKDAKAWEDPKEPYQKCIEADPNYYECYWRLGEAYLQTDDEQKALEFFTKAVEHEPRLQAVRDLGRLYLALGYNKEAEQVLKEGKAAAKADDKELYDIHVALAELYRDQANEVDQIAELQAAKKIANPESPQAVEILFNLGMAIGNAKNPQPQEAISMLKGFTARACKGAKAEKYKEQCLQAQAVLGRLEKNVH